MCLILALCVYISSGSASSGCSIQQEPLLHNSSSAALNTSSSLERPVVGPEGVEWCSGLLLVAAPPWLEAVFPATVRIEAISVGNVEGRGNVTSLFVQYGDFENLAWQCSPYVMVRLVCKSQPYYLWRCKYTGTTQYDGRAGRGQCVQYQPRNACGN